MAGEKNFENRLKRWLDGEGVWFVKFFANRNTRSGVPDIIACVGGTFVAIEVKGPGGKPSPLQLWHVAKIWAAGGIGLIVWPEDFDRLKELVRRLLKGGNREDVQDLVFEGRYLRAMPAKVRAQVHGRP